MTSQPDLREPGAALGLIKPWPGTGDGRRCRSVPANLDNASTRRRKERAGRDGERPTEIEQGNMTGGSVMPN
jgi:hypothetical protein